MDNTHGMALYRSLFMSVLVKPYNRSIQSTILNSTIIPGCKIEIFHIFHLMRHVTNANDYRDECG